MNRESLYWIGTSIVGLLVACTCFAGVDSSPVQRKQTHDATLGSELRPITIVSTPTGARIVINGEYVGTTPLLVDFAVDKLGRAIRNMEVRAVAPIPLVNEEIRRFPAAGSDGDASRVPHFLDFDLNIHPVFVIR
jgi:PEGA domain